MIDTARRKDERARNVRFDTRGGEREKQVLRSSSLRSESHQDDILRRLRSHQVDILRRLRDSGSLPRRACEAVQLGAMGGISVGLGERV